MTAVSEREETTTRTYETLANHIGAPAEFQATHGYAVGFFQSVILAKKPFRAIRQRCIRHRETLYETLLFEGRVGLAKMEAKTTETELLGETVKWIMSGVYL